MKAAFPQGRWTISEPVIVKSVEWAYPTSTNAVRFGRRFVGCWTVETGNRGEPLKAIKAFDTRAEAIEYALALPHEWTFAFLFCYPEYRRAA